MSNIDNLQGEFILPPSFKGLLLAALIHALEQDIIAVEIHLPHSGQETHTHTHTHTRARVS